VLARWLRVRAMKAVIAGGGRVARQMGAQLSAGGFDVVLIEHDPDSVSRSRAAGLRVEVGDATDVRLLQRLGAEEIVVAIGATDSDQVNLLFCQFVLAANPQAEAYSRVHQYDAVQAFREAGIHAVPEADAMTQALIDQMGAPKLHDALVDIGDRMALEIPVGTGLAGRRVRDLGLPERVLVLLIRRGNQEVIPHGNTVLARDDRMLIWGSSAAVTNARAALVAIE
jgi:Trk K+ transport system NAD-binding subunit